MTSKKNTNKDITFTGRALKCSECGEMSKNVSSSSKFNKNLCMQCLMDLIINDIKSKPY